MTSRPALLALAALAVATCEGDIAAPDRNASPRLASPIQHQIVPDSIVLDLARHFLDPDGDDLVYTAISSDTAAVHARLSHAVLTLTAVVKGAATVTVTAADPDGATASHSFPATVPNRPPRAIVALPDMEVLTGDRVVISVGEYFADPDRDPLTFSADPTEVGVGGVAFAGDEMTVQAFAPGWTTIAVTATDPEGLVATQYSVLTVPNRGPEVTESLPDLEVQAGERAITKMAGYFTDPDGEELVYEAESSNGGVAGVVVSDDELTVSAVAKGVAAITVAATDPGGLVAVQSFSVSVPNRAPQVVGSPSGIEVQVGDEVAVDMSVYFVDPDGDELALVAESSDTARAMAVVVTGEARVSGVAKGTATIAVTAMDPEGLTATVTFQATIPNRAPQGTEPLPDVEVEVGDTARAGLAAHFADPDGDELVFAAATPDTAVARVGVAGGFVMVDGVGKGTATVTVTATDTEGLFATQQFGVMVPNRAPRVTRTLGAVELVVGGESVIRVSDHFADPDGDPLIFAVESSDTAVARAVAEADRVTVRAVAVGTASVTVTAADSIGLAAVQTFRVTVPNREPVVETPIGGRQLDVGAEFTADLAGHITDPDGQALVFSAESSDTAVAIAAAAGSELTVRGVARGHATITVTATDPGGLAAALGFGVTVPNRMPRIEQPLRDVNLGRGGQFRIRISRYFSDPDDDTLAFSARSSDTSVVKVQVTDHRVHLSGIDPGRATITVTATDPYDLSATQTFDVKVQLRNRAPRPTGTIPDHSLEPGEEVKTDLPDFFTDPDGDGLTFTAQSTDSAVTEVTVSDNQLATTAIDPGTAAVTVTATDPGGLSAMQVFAVVVGDPPTDGAPRPIGRIGDRSLHEGEGFGVDVSDYFTDPDGDPLTFAASSSQNGVARATVSGNDLSVTAISAGRATLTVVATDPGGLSGTQTFQVFVQRRGATGDFDIKLVFTDSVPTAYHTSLQAAAVRWMSILGDTEWPDVAVDDTKTCRDVEVDLDVVDDLVVSVDAVEMDGELGTVARAGVCMAREGSYAPILGYVRFDKVDLGILEQYGDLVEIMVHEVAHVLGFGPRWVQLGLLDQESDPHFTGVRAIAAFDSVGGADYPDAKVPTQPGQGHWRESVLGSELLTPNLYVNRREPLSMVTLAALADMGYHVDFSLADDYRLDGAQSDIGAMDPGPLVNLAGDFERGPVMILDRDGNVLRVIFGR